MRILLDECVDHRLSKAIVGHHVETVGQRGWSGTKNGDLLVLAAQEYEVLVTTDRNLAFQQNVQRFEIGIVVLAAKSNHLDALKGLVPELLKALPFTKAGQIRKVGI
jgi:predicted nuclease of predicted toxin-antitoxin system